MSFELINNADSLAMYRKFFPHVTPNIFQQELIESCIDDLEVWEEVMVLWAGNDYRALSIKKMIDCYDDKVKEKQPKSYNYVNKQPTQREAIEAEQKMIELMEVQ